MFRGNGRGNVYEQDGRIDEFRQTNGTICRFDFGESRMGRSVVFGRKELPLFEFLGHPQNHIVVFRVNHRREVVFARFEQDIEDLRVVELEHFVSHVDFQTGDSGLAEEWELGEGERRRVTEDDMEGVVGIRASGGFGVSGFERREDTFFRSGLWGEG